MKEIGGEEDDGEEKPDEEEEEDDDEVTIPRKRSAGSSNKKEKNKVTQLGKTKASKSEPNRDKKSSVGPFRRCRKCRGGHESKGTRFE
jgi:hypothetical protein